MTVGLLLALQLASSDGQAFDDPLSRRVTPIVQVVEATRPAVVHIQSNLRGRSRAWPWARPVEQRISGSGVVIYEEGYIVTNYHVVRGAQRLEVRFDPAQDETVYPAALISFDEAEDLALIKIEGEEPFPTVPLGISSDLMIGETVVAIGNPYGQTLTVSTGIISGLHRDVRASGLTFTNLIQTDASINPGNSGGPLLNINGEVIGINTVVNTAAENIGFAIPADQLRRVLSEVLLQPDGARGWLGFELDLEGLAVDTVVPGSPAAEEGIRVGDRLVSIDGKPVRTAEEYKLARISILPGRTAAMRFRRGSRWIDVDLEAWNPYDFYAYQKAGLTVEPINIGGSRRVRITKVRAESPAAELGLRRGDIIHAVQPDGRRIRTLRSPDDLAILLRRLPAETELLLQVWRDDNGNGTLERSRSRNELYRGTLRLR